MANLVETPQWPAGIYQIETTDPVVGGPPDLPQGQGIANAAAQQLADRTLWLKNALASSTSAAALLTSIKTVDGTGSGLDADLLDGKHAAHFATQADFDALSGSVVTQADIDNAIAALIGGAPGALDTLNELAAAVADDASFAASITNALAGKLPIGGTAADASKLGGALAANYARTNLPETFTLPVTFEDTVIVKGNAHFGEEGGGNTDVYFWDDTAKVWRVMHWNNAGQDWYVHDKNNVLRKVHHDGNSDFLPSSGGNVTGNLDVEGGNMGVNAFDDTANAHLWLRDDNGDPMGLLFWDRANSSLKLIRYNPTTGVAEDVFKVKAGGVQFNGNTLWHAGNDGGGSGLVADLLDGWHGSQFMLRTDLATLGAVNTTALMDRGASTAVSVLTAGTIVSAALLYYCDRASGRDLVNRPSGLWMCTGYAANFDRGTTFVRVS
jgi:hypothetical protein